MDWPGENAGITDADFENVFRYGKQETTAVRFLTTDSAPRLWRLLEPNHWLPWLSEGTLSFDENSHGVYMILARRGGQKTNLFDHLEDGTFSFGTINANEAFQNISNEKSQAYSWPKGGILSNTPSKALAAYLARPSAGGGKRQVRQLPFDKDIFQELCRKFYVHHSIARVINRADVPHFSRAEVQMGKCDKKSHTAWIYNCRSSNTWSDDLAMTVTHFPHNNLTFAIVFGCTEDTERHILNRLAEAKEHILHPFLLPGIFAELERERMAEVVETTIDEIEGMIFELDTGVNFKNTQSEYVESNRRSENTRSIRRRVWLNTTFLRSRLQIWKTQLAKMVEHVDELSCASENDGSTCPSDKGFKPATLRTSRMIKERLRALIEEVDEKIEDCTMRVDGMTMATQWSHGDTNTDIASAAGEDSRQMRSISLVTMVFLPGTFFATIFSMTFFDWSGEGAIVSGYIWIYCLVTVAFTAVTLFAWWYFLVYRQTNTRPLIRLPALSSFGCCGMV